jgi:hypothetical protein
MVSTPLAYAIRVGTPGSLSPAPAAAIAWRGYARLCRG